ncbi:MAG: hypothetical protein U9P07_04045 [Pseudomonadota bacterium]|nr:hypothetical protein [Pseudomonadota bacterium]
MTSSCYYSTFLVTIKTTGKNLSGCSGMVLAHSRRPSMAGFRGVRRTNHIM